MLKLLLIFSAPLVLSNLANADVSLMSYHYSEAERQADKVFLESKKLRVPAQGVLPENAFTEISTRAFSIPTNWFFQRPKNELSLIEALADVDIFQVIYEKAYSGYEVAEKKGWKWSEFFDDWRAELKAYGTQNIPLFAVFKPYERYRAFQLDNHSDIYLNNNQKISNSISAIVDVKSFSSCTEMRMSDGNIQSLQVKDQSQQLRNREVFDSVSGQLNPIFYIAYPAPWGNTTAVKCGGIWQNTRIINNLNQDELVKNVTGLSGKKTDIPAYRAISSNIAYLRFPQFVMTNENYLSYLDLYNSIPSGHQHDRLLIVDMRNNYGGNGNLALFALKKWFPKNFLEKSIPKINFKKSCITKSLEWGTAQAYLNRFEPPYSDDMVAMYQKHLDTFLSSKETPGCPVSWDQVTPDWYYEQHQFKPSSATKLPMVMVLIDNFCGSSCESIVHILARSPRTLIVGKNTFGVGEFAQPNYFVLPNSRLSMGVAVGHAQMYGDLRSFEGFGLDVDILMTRPEEQQPAYVLKLAEKMLSSFVNNNETVTDDH